MEIKRTTKRAKLYAENYTGSNCKSILDCYKNPSSAKWYAELAIIENMVKRGGFDYRVISYNSNFFSCAFRFRDKRGDLWLAVFTPYNNYNINLSGDDLSPAAVAAIA